MVVPVTDNGGTFSTTPLIVIVAPVKSFIDGGDPNETSDARFVAEPVPVVFVEDGVEADAPVEIEIPDKL